ncbi:MAG: hypothetical protein HC806_01270 [Anaerolineae bacterium]|nr:hypothetical protein [Anaerolineae bacterium]
MGTLNITETATVTSTPTPLTPDPNPTGEVISTPFTPLTPTDVDLLTPVEVTKLPAPPSLLAKSFPETFVNTPPIWLHAEKGSEHEIVLFRHAFELTEPTIISELQIFADTRYEVWLDGEWLGRGPARFSCTLREYDVYPLETLSPGYHYLAVLVQWAPNTRRSESNTPLLQARIQDYRVNGPVTVAQTSSDWKAISADAWNQDAGLVHAWELIGPMELLDFRYLPESWMQPAFVDFIWGNAVQTKVFGNSSRNLTEASQVCYRRGISSFQVPVYQPRSISFLTNNVLTPSLLEAGWLSPNRLTIQPDETEKSYDLQFNVTEPTVFSVEVLDLTSSMPITDAITLDQRPLSWTPAGSNRPDVFTGLSVIQPGGTYIKQQKTYKAFPRFLTVFYRWTGDQCRSTPIRGSWVDIACSSPNRFRVEKLSRRSRKRISPCE